MTAPVQISASAKAHRSAKYLAILSAMISLVLGGFGLAAHTATAATDTTAAAAGSIGTIVSLLALVHVHLKAAEIASWFADGKAVLHQAEVIAPAFDHVSAVSAFARLHARLGSLESYIVKDLHHAVANKVTTSVTDALKVFVAEMQAQAAPLMTVSGPPPTETVNGLLDGTGYQVAPGPAPGMAVSDYQPAASASPVAAPVIAPAAPVTDFHAPVGVVTMPTPATVPDPVDVPPPSVAAAPVPTGTGV